MPEQRSHGNCFQTEGRPDRAMKGEKKKIKKKKS